MLSISQAMSASTAIGYHRNQLAPGQSGYYTNDHEPPGRWRGQGAKALGLDGPVTEEAFARCLLGVDQDNKKLVQNGGDMDRRAGWDLTFSAPKSVSVLWGLAGAEGDRQLQNTIQRAHDQAVDKALKKLESEYLFRRTGSAGAVLERANLTAGVFSHGTSREQDPQLHSHCVVINFGLGESGSSTLQSQEFYKAKMALGAFYRAELASELDKNLGLAIERDGRSFKLAGMPQDLEKQFSKRRGQIEKSMAQHGVKSAAGASVAALDTRQAKTNVATEQLYQSWQEQAAELGHSLSSVTEELSKQAQEQEREMPSHSDMLSQLTEQASTASKYQLQAAVYEAAQGVCNTQQADQYISELLKSDELITLREADGSPRYTSREMYDLERDLAASAEARQSENHQVSKQAVEQALDARPTLSGEQKNMLAHVTGPEGVSCVQGMAGSGKSYALGAAKTAFEADQKNVIGCALAGKAAAGLEEAAGIKSQTIHSLLIDLENGKQSLNKNSVLVVDEAGMVGSRLLHKVMTHANEAGSKVVLVGDSRQLQPIDAGGAFRLIQERIGACKISEIRRQRSDWQRQAVHDLAGGDAARALRAYSEHGLVHTSKTHGEVCAEIVKNYLSDRATERAPGETLMLAATRSDVFTLNRLTREALMSEGELSSDQADQVQVNETEFTSGDRILFTRNSKELDVKNGTLGTLKSASPDRFSVETDDGKIIDFNPADYEHVQHGYAVTNHKAQGSTVDNSHVLIHESMSAREWSYVAASRHRIDCHLYATTDTYQEAARVMSKSNQADTSQDYQREEQYHEQKSELHAGAIEPHPSAARSVAAGLPALPELGMAEHEQTDRGREERNGVLPTAALDHQGADHDLRRDDKNIITGGTTVKAKTKGFQKLLDKTGVKLPSAASIEADVDARLREQDRWLKEQQGKFWSANSQFNREQNDIRRAEKAAREAAGKIHDWKRPEQADPAQNPAQNPAPDSSIEAPGAERLEASAWGDIFNDANVVESEDHTRIELPQGEGVILDYDGRLVTHGGVSPEVAAAACAKKFSGLENGVIEITANDPDKARGQEWVIGVVGWMIEEWGYERTDFSLETMGIPHEELDARGIGVNTEAERGFYRDLDNDGLTDHLEDDRGLEHDPSGPVTEPVSTEPVSTEPVSTEPTTSTEPVPPHDHEPDMEI